MPKVLRIINRFNLGGPTYNVGYLTKYLAPRFETLLVGGAKDDTEESSEFILEQMGIKPVIIPEMRRQISPLKDWEAYKKIKKLIKEFKPDIVHTHAAKAGTIGRTAAYNSKVPVIVHTFHGHVFHSYFGKTRTAVFKNIERYLAARSSAIVAISERQKEELSQIHRIVNPEKVSVIRLGFDLSRFSEDQEEKRKKFRSKYQVEGDEVAIGIVGRLVPVKNHRLFLETIHRLRITCNKRIRAFIIGNGESMPQVAACTKELNLDHSFSEKPALLHFTSWMRDVDVAYAGLDIVVLTSFNEGTPVSLIEAQAAGKPVVSTRVGGIENIVSHNRSGFLCNASDRNNFFENLKDLVENDSKRRDFGVNGKENVIIKYHYTRLVSDMDALYAKLLECPQFPAL